MAKYQNNPAVMAAFQKIQTKRQRNARPHTPACAANPGFLGANPRFSRAALLAWLGAKLAGEEGAR